MADKKTGEHTINRREFLKLTAKAALGLTAATALGTGLIRLAENLDTTADTPYEKIFNLIGQLQEGELSPHDFKDQIPSILANLLRTKTPDSLGSVWIKTGYFKDSSGYMINLTFDSTQEKDERLGMDFNLGGSLVYPTNPVKLLQEEKLDDNDFYFNLVVNSLPYYNVPTRGNSVVESNTFLLTLNDMKVFNGFTWYQGRPLAGEANAIMSVTRREDYQGKPLTLFQTYYAESGMALSKGTEFDGTSQITINKKGEVTDSYTYGIHIDPNDLPDEFNNWNSMVHGTPFPEKA